ncbi:MAG TPA: hypothetical protein VF665_16985 [Longimicrobium sp.]|jgi:hypothetical protein|uniref:hypothetical protein n=1 Tax=Longimicrobium sp. TaxID=2029185 RepID=UPI002ED94C52
MNKHIRLLALLACAAVAACDDGSSPEVPPTPPPPAPLPVGVYRIAVDGIGTENATSSVVSVAPETGVSAALAQAGSGIVFEQVGSSSFTEGTRGQGGQRYVSFTYRVRNSTATPLSNLTMLLVSRASSVPGTALSTLRRFDGAAADPAIASQVIPTGAVTMGRDLVSMKASYPDVLQVLTEAEVAAITPPAGVSNIFPVGYVVRHRTAATNRTLPVAGTANDFDGVLTVSFRVPLQASAAQDVFSFFFEVLAVTDTETRLTESIEEAQDPEAVTRLQAAAAALGATTVTVLNGSPRIAPDVFDYTGQRVVCSPRVAGTAASPVTTIVAPGAHTGYMILTAGEVVDPCAAYFRSGTSARPATNVPFGVTVKAADRYGNVLTGLAADTVRLEISGPAATPGAASALVAGSTAHTATFHDYGMSQVSVAGRRVRGGTRPILVAGVTRAWTAGAGTTDWHTATNWSPAAVPMSQDSVLIPAAAPLDPVLAANVAVMDVTVEESARIEINAFDLTAGGNVTTAITTGQGITNTSGRLICSGTAKTIQGRIPRVRFTGTYSLTGNLTLRAPWEVAAGRLTTGTFRVQIESF